MMPQPEFEVPTWNQIYEMLLSQAEKIRKSGFKPNITIAISRGGWLPARVLSDLLENPNLLEHDTFTDTLWAVFHLTDELAHREDLKSLPETDVRHLSGDIDRAYKCIVAEWLEYMKHLKRDYPYLFSLAVRTNPFDPAARVEVG